MSALVRPFAIVQRGSGLEPLTPQLRAAFTEMANYDPYSLYLALGMNLPGDNDHETLAAYFTPRQRALMERQRRETEEEIERSRLIRRSQGRSEGRA